MNSKLIGDGEFHDAAQNERLMRGSARMLTPVLAMFLILVLFLLPAAAQEYTPPPPPPPAEAPLAPAQVAPPPTMAPQQLDQLVSRIALYPDPLLAQVLTASTYWQQIPEADQWANQHRFLTGASLANAIREDNLGWDPSVMALLPFPSVLNMMAQDPGWTEQLGNAVLVERGAVMDAIQRMRSQAYSNGYLRTSPYDTVVGAPGELEILPVNPSYIYVPTYNPTLLFGPPVPGFALRFGPAVVLGAPFVSFGWAHPYFEWRTHGIFFDYTPWGRGWANRGYYVHPYEHPFVRQPGPRVERHAIGGGRRR